MAGEVDMKEYVSLNVKGLHDEFGVVSMESHRKMKDAAKQPSEGEIKKCLVSHVLKRFEEMSNDEKFTAWLKKADESEQLYFGDQFTEAMKAQLDDIGQAALVVNEIRPVVKHAVSIMSSKNPSFEVVGVTEMDPLNAWVFREVAHHVLRNNFFPKQAERSTRSMLVAGRGSKLIFWDSELDDGRGDIGIKYINRHNLLIDRDAKDWAQQDAVDMMITDTITVDRAIESYPKHRKRILKYVSAGLQGMEYDRSRVGDQEENFGNRNLGTDANSQENLDKIRMYEYFRRITVEVWETTEKDIGRVREFYTDDDMLDYVKQMEADGRTRKNGQLSIEKRKVKRIEHAIIIGEWLVEYNILPTFYYPIINYVDEDTENPFPYGEIEMLKGYQEFINKAAAIVILNAQVGSNFKILMEEDALPTDTDQETWQTNYSKPGSLNLLAPDAISKSKVKEVQNIALNQAFNMMWDKITGKLQAHMGLFGLAMGDPSEAPETHKATLQLREWALEKINPMLRNVDYGNTLLGRVLVRYIQAYYPPNKAIRVSLDRGDEEFEMLVAGGKMNANGTMEINKAIYSEERIHDVLNDLSVGKYDLDAVPRSYLPTNKMAELVMMKELADAGIVDGEAVIDKLDIPDKWKIKHRMSVTKQQASQLNAMAEQVKKLQADTESKDKKIMGLAMQIQLLNHEMKLKQREFGAYAESRIAGRRIGDELKNLEQLSAEMRQEMNKAQKRDTPGGPGLA